MTGFWRILMLVAMSFLLVTARYYDARTYRGRCHAKCSRCRELCYVPNESNCRSAHCAFYRR